MEEGKEEEEEEEEEVESLKVKYLESLITKSLLGSAEITELGTTKDSIFNEVWILCGRSFMERFPDDAKFLKKNQLREVFNVDSQDFLFGTFMQLIPLDIHVVEKVDKSSYNKKFDFSQFKKDFRNQFLRDYNQRFHNLDELWENIKTFARNKIFLKMNIPKKLNAPIFYDLCKSYFLYFCYENTSEITPNEILFSSLHPVSIVLVQDAILTSLYHTVEAIRVNYNQFLSPENPLAIITLMPEITIGKLKMQIKSPSPKLYEFVEKAMRRFERLYVVYVVYFISDAYLNIEKSPEIIQELKNFFMVACLLTLTTVNDYILVTPDLYKFLNNKDVFESKYFDYSRFEKSLEHYFKMYNPMKVLFFIEAMKKLIKILEENRFAYNTSITLFLIRDFITEKIDQFIHGIWEKLLVTNEKITILDKKDREIMNVIRTKINKSIESKAIESLENFKILFKEEEKEPWEMLEKGEKEKEKEREKEEKKEKEEEGRKGKKRKTEYKLDWKLHYVPEDLHLVEDLESSLFYIWKTETTFLRTSTSFSRTFTMDNRTNYRSMSLSKMQYIFSIKKRKKNRFIKRIFIAFFFPLLFFMENILESCP